MKFDSMFLVKADSEVKHKFKFLSIQDITSLTTTGLIHLDFQGHC